MKLSIQDIKEKYLNKIQVDHDVEEANIFIQEEQGAAMAALTAAVDRLQGDVYEGLTNMQAFELLTMHSKLMGTKTPESGDLLLCRVSLPLCSRFYHNAVLIKGKESDPNDDEWRVYEIEIDNVSRTSEVICSKLETWLKNTFQRRHMGKFHYAGIFVSNEVPSFDAPELRSRCEAAVRNNGLGNYMREFSFAPFLSLSLFPPSQS